MSVDLTDWHSDGHRLVVAPMDDDKAPWLHWAVRCPGDVGLPCLTPIANGGIQQSPYDRCGLDQAWPEDIPAGLDPACSLYEALSAADILERSPKLYAIFGVREDQRSHLMHLDIAWRVNSDGDGLIWAPTAWVEAQRQVAA